LWNRNKNNNNNKPEIKRNQEKKATKSAATNRHTSTGAGTSATNNNSIGDDPYANADPGCWLLREMIFNGSAVCVEMGEKEDIKGKSIEDGIAKFKKNPHKYIAMMYQSNMLEWPAANQVYTLIHRKGTVGYEPKGIGPSGHLTLLLFDYQRLPAFKDNVLPKASRDKYTDSVLSKFNGLKLHNNYKPVMPGRGMGCCDMPNLKIIGNVDPSDIAQGSVGNCWLLSGISALAEFDGAVKHLFRKTKNLNQMPLSIKGSNAGNMYTISLWDLKTWKEVDIVVDERLCVDNNGQLLASKPSADGELWVCYLEKAIAAHCGGWDKIVGGQCTHAWALLTGCKEQYTIRKNKETGKFECFAKYNPYDKKWAEHANSPHDGVQSMWRAPWPKVGGGGDEKLALDEEELFQRMCAWDDVNYIVGASTEGVSDKNSTDGLVDNHAYSVLESINDVAGTEIDMIKVRNPWGRGEIENGMFDDDGPGWDRYPQIKKALNPVVADDGIFWVTKQEFFHYYGTIYLSASNMTEFLED
jgi:Calpain family cysteine protease